MTTSLTARKNHLLALFLRLRKKMPELPEVETTIRGLQAHVCDAVVEQVIIRQPQLRWPIPANLSQILQQQTIRQLSRRGKYILLQFDHGTLIIHLGMSGRLCLFTQSKPVNKHDHVDIIFSSQLLLRYTDPRRFGAILWTAEPIVTHPLLSKLGVEPLSAAFTSNYLLKQLGNRRAAIKPLLMNHHIVVGVGNIYANEALYLAKIHPLLPGYQLTLIQAERLVAAIQQVLSNAIDAGGTTLKDFVDSRGKPGYFSQQLRVYGRSGLLCGHCQTKLQAMVLAQRQTVFCPTCQSL